MTLLLYALTFIPIALITLVVHELGHLITARALTIKVSGFQIGIGPTLLTIYTGNTRIPLTPTSLVQGLTPQLPSKGDLATAYLTTDDTHQRQTLAVLPLAGYGHHPDIHQSVHRQFSQHAMQITGKVRTVEADHIIMADIAWTLKVIPLMAAVYLPEDPSKRIPHLYNTTTWTHKAIITFAGPLANFLFFAALIVALATIPAPTPTIPLLTVTSVKTESPAANAGFHLGDRIVQANTTLIPQHRDIAEALHNAYTHNDAVTFHIHRGPDNLIINVTPDPDTGHIGLTLAPEIPQPSPTANPQPSSVPRKVLTLTNIYFDSFAALLSADTYSDNNTHLVMGPIATAYYTAQAVQYAKLKAWLAILAAVTLATGFLNLFPIPPLDGYRILLNTIETLRHQQMNPRLERVIMYSGISFLIFAGIYLLLYDIILILT